MRPPEERYRATVRTMAEELRSLHGDAAAHLVLRAFDYAAVHHQGQRRRNGDPYLAHTVAVARIVADVRADHVLVAAALLHDVVDRPFSSPRLRDLVGHDVVDLVEMADELERPVYPDQGLDAVDHRVLLLKLSDRLHNLHTIDALERRQQLTKADHTLAVLVPVAERAGIPLDRPLRQAATRTIHSPPGGRQAAQGSARRHQGVSARLISVAAILLPQPARSRWLDEWRAELAAIPGASQRLQFAIDVVLGAPVLALTSWHKSSEDTS